MDCRTRASKVAVAAEPTPAAGLGGARFVRMAEQSEIAEFSFTVIDAIQGKGLGRALLAMLYLSAAERQIQILRAVCLPENQSVVSWLCRLGAENKGTLEGTVELDLHIKRIPDLSTTPGCTADRFARTLDKLGRALAEARAKLHSPSNAGNKQPGTEAFRRTFRPRPARDYPIK